MSIFLLHPFIPFIFFERQPNPSISLFLPSISSGSSSSASKSSSSNHPLQSSSSSASSPASSSNLHFGLNYNLFGSYDLLFGVTRIESPCDSIHNLFSASPLSPSSSSSPLQQQQNMGPSSSPFDPSAFISLSSSLTSSPDGERKENKSNKYGDKNEEENKEEEVLQEEGMKRDKILRTLVRNLYSYHLHVRTSLSASLPCICCLL